MSMQQCFHSDWTYIYLLYSELSAELVSQYQEECQFLQSEKSRLEKKILSLQLTEESLRDNDSRVKFYTDVSSFKVLHVSSHVTDCSRSSLSVFQQFLLTLMKLRLNLNDQDLAYRRVSDKHLIEQCGILENLIPGDQILADRGFNIAHSVGLCCAELKIPSFTKGKKQLSQVEMDSSRRLSHVQIHVERVLGVLRQKYSILESTMPINTIMCDENSEISLIDEIVTVCSALCNCCESIVPFE